MARVLDDAGRQLGAQRPLDELPRGFLVLGILN